MNLRVGLACTLSLMSGTPAALAQVAPATPTPAPAASVSRPNAAQWGPPPPPGAPRPVVLLAAPPTELYRPAQRGRELYQGGPIPPGGRLVTDTRADLMIGGAATFFATWGAAAIAGAVIAPDEDRSGLAGSRDSAAWWLLVPIGGPVRYGIEADASVSTWLLLGFDAFAQAVGASMFFWGLSHPATYVVFEGEARRTSPTRPRWTLLPGTAASPHGASLRVQF